MSLLPEMRSGRMKTSVILIVLLLVCMAFLGFRYWTVYQLSDRYQRRITFLERTIYKNARDEDVADVREKDFQRELKRQKEKVVQMNAMMNSEVAKMGSKFQLERENLLNTVDSKNAVIKQDGELFSRLKKDYEDLQQHMASFQVNQSHLLEMFTAQSVKVEMLVKLKDACYAQMRSLGRRVSVPAGLNKAMPARQGPGEPASAKDHPEVGIPPRASVERVLPPRESPAGVTPARQSAVDEKHAPESPELGVPARGSPNIGVSSQDSPAGGTQGRQSAMVESPAHERPEEVVPAREGPKEKLPARQSPLAASQGQPSVNENAIKKDVEAAPAPALVPSNSRVLVSPPQLGKEHKDLPPEPGVSPLGKSDIEVKTGKKAASDVSRVKDNEDLPPFMKKDENVPVGGTVDAPGSKIQPDSQPKEKQNNKEMEEEGEEEEAPDYVP